MNELSSFIVWALGIEFSLGVKHLYLMNHLITGMSEVHVRIPHTHLGPTVSSDVIRGLSFHILCPLGGGEVGQETGSQGWGTGELAPIADQNRDLSSEMHRLSFWKPGHGGMHL